MAETCTSPTSLSRTNPYLSGPDARYLHARNVATSTAVETGGSVKAYMARCLDGAGGAVGPGAKSRRQAAARESSEPGRSSRGRSHGC